MPPLKGSEAADAHTPCLGWGLSAVSAAETLWFEGCPGPGDFLPHFMAVSVHTRTHFPQTVLKGALQRGGIKLARVQTLQRGRDAEATAAAVWA